MKCYTCLLLLLLTSPALAQTTRYVSATGANTNPVTATSWVLSTSDLQGAINASASGDQVWVAGGLYKPTTTTGPASRSISFGLKNGVAVYGGFVGNETTLGQRPAINPISGQPSSSTLSGDIGTPMNFADNSYHVVTSLSALTTTAVLDGFVITAGNANGSSPYSTGYGGGIANTGGSPTFRNLSFISNKADLVGGGGLCNMGGSPTLNNVLFLANSAGSGYAGGMYNSSNSPVLTNVSFQNNNSYSGGGAMYNYASDAKLVNVSFLSNTTSDGGGGLRNSSSSATLINVSFVGNYGGYYGGGIYNKNSSYATLTNVSFQNNQAVFIPQYGYGGGAVCNESSSTLSMTNAVLFGNNGGNSSILGSVTATYSLFENTITGYSSSATNLTTAVSPFAATNGVALATCSIAVNAGNNSATGLTGISTDLAGNPRIVGAQVDMGAVEFQASPASPARLYVNASASGANTGLTWADALTDLQSALTYPCSQSLTEVWVAAGLYKPTQTTGPASRSISFAMLPNVAIYGGFVGNETNLGSRPAIQPRTGQPSSTTLSGEIGDPASLTDNSYHVVSTTGLTTSAVLDGFVLTAGKADGYAVYSMGVGGGMYNTGSSPTLQNLSFLNNQVLNDGAGLYNTAGSNPVITNCLFNNNSAFNGYGGGMLNNGSSPVLTNVSFVKNNCYSAGGGMGNTSGSSPTLTNVSFVSNGATSGGGMYNSTSSGPTLINVAFINNYGAYNGGGLYNDSPIPTLYNVSFLNNRVGLTGSGFGGWAIYNASGTPSLRNCILFGNGGSNAIGGNGLTATFSLFESTVTGYSSSTTNLTTAVSPFAATNGVALAACSPAINAGSNGGLIQFITTDLAGNPRLVGARVDMGAVEFQTTPTPPTRLYVNASATGANTGLTWADALTDLQSALTYPCSQSLAEVWVAGGLYKPTTTTGPASRSVSFALLTDAAIYGGFVGNETSLSSRPIINPNNGQPSSSTLSGEIGDPTSTTDNSYHVVSTTALTTSAVLDGFVITAGYANGTNENYGGGIRNVGGNPRFTNLLLQNNRALGGGGGMSNSNSNSVLTNVIFQSNTVNDPGGHGGGMFNGLGTLLLINVSFQNNTTYGMGGGLYNYGGSQTLINTAFQNNQSDDGGAIYNSSASPVLINVSLRGNQANFGSAMGNYTNSNPVLKNCIVFDNSILNGFAESNITTVTYSLFQPSLATVSGMNVSGPGNLTTTISPFASPNSVALATNSLAINAGNVASYTAANGPTTDLPGNLRIVGAGIDMGAVEFQGGSGAVYTVQNGNWSDASTWNVNRLPIASESIGVYHAVQVNGIFQIKRVVYGPGGRLIFDSAGRIQFQ